MKAFIDNKLLRKLQKDEAESKKNILLDLSVQADLLADGQQLQLVFGWPSLLEFIGLGNLFENFPTFNDQNKLFNLILSTLATELDKDILIYLYDQIFVECLIHVKALPQIDSHFLLDQIQKKRESSLTSYANELFSSPLDHYEKLLIENSSHAMHALILYLAWDRVCVNLAIVFESVTSSRSRNGLEILKECLIESFQHITAQGRTTLSFFRMLETLYAFQMRPENFSIYTDAEWLTLCQSSRALKSREEFSDVFYIDATIIDRQDVKKANKERELLNVFTMDSIEKVKASFLLARYMLDKLKLEIPGWAYTLSPVKIVYLQESERGFLVNIINK
jgi:hypothetical protein